MLKATAVDCDILSFYEEKLKNFCNYLLYIAKNKESAEMIKNKTGNRWLDLYYLLRLSSEQKNKDIDDIISKLDIGNEHKGKISEYYDLFLEIKSKYIEKI